jgi:catechol 2,3-dioxygenase-like lactoylglutathione lyase family enzyme
LVSVPVADVDRAKAFYVDQVGFGVEQDMQVDEEHRFVELMPPGSPCSIALTAGEGAARARTGARLDVPDRAVMAQKSNFVTQQRTPRRDGNRLTMSSTVITRPGGGASRRSSNR